MNVDVWQLLTALGAALVVLTGAGFAVFKMLLASFEKRLSEKFSVLESAGQKQAEEWQRVERQLMEMKADLPINYVRREDYIRSQSVIEAKLDGLAMRIENALLKGVKHGS